MLQDLRALSQPLKDHQMASGNSYGHIQEMLTMKLVAYLCLQAICKPSMEVNLSNFDIIIHGSNVDHMKIHQSFEPSTEPILRGVEARHGGVTEPFCLKRFPAPVEEPVMNEFSDELSIIRAMSRISSGSSSCRPQ